MLFFLVWLDLYDLAGIIPAQALGQFLRSYLIGIKDDPTCARLVVCTGIEHTGLFQKNAAHGSGTARSGHAADL